MNLDWVKMGVSSGGTGTITCTTQTGYADPTDYWGTSGSRFVNYCINDEANALREHGLGAFNLATMVLTRTRIDATFNAGTGDNTSPTALNFGTTGVYVTVEPVANGFVPAMPFYAVANEDLGLASAHNKLAVSAYTPVADREVYVPFLWTGQGEVVQAGVRCSTNASAGVKLALYELLSSGLPGKRLYDFGALDLTSATLVVTTASPLPFWLPPGWYYAGFILNSITPRLSGVASSQLPNPLGTSGGAVVDHVYASGNYTTGLPDPAATALTYQVGITPNLYLKPRNT